MGMKQFTLKQLLVGIGLLCVEMGLAAPAVSGDQSDTSQSLFICSVVLLCTITGGVLGAAIGRTFNHPFIGATILAMAGFLFGFLAGAYIGIAFLGWPM